MKASVLIPTIRKLYGLLSRKHRIYWGLAIVLSIGFSLVETIGISAIMPFISIASNPELLDSGLYRRVFDFVGVGHREFVIYFGIAIIVFYMFRAAYGIIHTYLISRFSNAVSRYFSIKIFDVTLSLPYTAYTQKNSGEIMGVINSETQQMKSVSMNILKFFTELFKIIMIYTLLIIVNWQMTLVLTFVLAFFVIIFMKVLVSKNKLVGKKRIEADKITFRLLMEAFSNFKFIRLKGNGDELINNYGKAKLKATKAYVTSDTLNATPKNILESIGFSLLIAAIISILVRYDDASMVLPVISMYALALFRILPSIHRLYQNINGIAFMQHSLDTIAELIRQPIENEGNEPIVFNKSISLRNVSFQYVPGNEVIHNISLSIHKGEKIAITGESGGGKSTLIDLVIGILKPCSGEIAIDEKPLCEKTLRSWRQEIGYIPQKIYLFDGTVGENVAYGSKVDAEKLKSALQRANIWDFLLTKEGIDTRVGEGGIQLSGGQQQRIGIARALYNDPEILVLDEATSALDNETEKKIMDEIYCASEDKTLIVIAHRLSTVERCDRTIRVESGKVAESLSKPE